MNHSAIKHRRLYSLLKEKNLIANRHDLVFSFSDGATESSSDLSEQQVDDLIAWLQNYDKEKETHSGVSYDGQQMRRKILSMCYTIGWTRWDSKDKKHQVDYDRLDSWMRKYSYLHKGLNQYTYNELPTVVTQFENLMRSEL